MELAPTRPRHRKSVTRIRFIKIRVICVICGNPFAGKGMRECTSAAGGV